MIINGGGIASSRDKYRNKRLIDGTYTKVTLYIFRGIVNYESNDRIRKGR